MALGDKLLRYAKLNPAEEKIFRLLFIQSMLGGFGSAFYFVVVSSYFIKKTSVASLPSAYIISGIIGFLIISWYRRYQRSSGIFSSYVMALLAFSVTSVILYAVRLYWQDFSGASVYMAYAGFALIMPFSTMLALGFSTVCLSMFNIAQSKRLLALIGTGEVVASVIAYLIVPLLTKWMGGSLPLLLFAAATNLAGIIPLYRLYNNNKQLLDNVKLGAIKKMNFAFFRKDRFYSLIAIVTLFSVLAIYLADYSYLLSVRYMSTESGIEIATIVAVIFSIIKAGELMFSLFSGAIISSRGMKFSMLILPLALLLSSFMASLFGIVFSSIPFYVVAFLLLNKWNERVLRKGLTVPSTKVLYQVAEPEERAQLQTSVDGTLNQLATIVAGVLLLIVSTIFSGKDVLSFLKMISFVCLLAFAVWTWVTFNLFASYRIKIKEYLDHIKNRKKQPAAITNEVNGKEITEIVNATAPHQIVSGALREKIIINNHTVNEFLLFYNPALKNTLNGGAISLPQLNIAYYNNENFFSRMLIISFIGFQNYQTRVSFVKEYYAVSELQLRIQMIAMLNNTGYTPLAENMFFFTGLCQDCISEIMYAEAAIHDTSSIDDEKLTNALKEHIATLKNLLFELLKILYDKEAIQAIREVMNSKDRSLENHLFAVELLDSSLKSEMKKLVVPLFEDISFNAKKEKLQKVMLIYQLSPEERLKDLLMANFMIIGPDIKQLALEDYYKLTDDRTALIAFSSSQLENLKATALNLLNQADDKLFSAKIKTIETLNLANIFNSSAIAYYIKWGLFASAQKQASGKKQTYQFNTDYTKEMLFGNNKLSVDTFGLALMFKLNGVNNFRED